ARTERRLDPGVPHPQAVGRRQLGAVRPPWGPDDPHGGDPGARRGGARVAERVRRSDERSARRGGRVSQVAADSSGRDARSGGAGGGAVIRSRRVVPFVSLWLALASGALPLTTQAANPPDDGIALTLDYGSGPGQIALQWNGGLPTFQVFRSNRPDDVVGFAH